MMILGCGLQWTLQWPNIKTTSKCRKWITIISLGKGTAVIRYILSLWAAEVYCTIIVCFILSFFLDFSCIWKHWRFRQFILPCHNYNYITHFSFPNQVLTMLSVDMALKQLWAFFCHVLLSWFAIMWGTKQPGASDYLQVEDLNEHDHLSQNRQSATHVLWNLFLSE